MHYSQAKQLLSSTNGMNLCHGCLHGCIYCDARSNCYQINHLFEDINIKQNAPDLLEHSLRHKRKKCMISTGSMSDPYINLKESLDITRRCLELIDNYNFGLAIQTKSDLILGDIDLLDSINRKSKCVVQMTLTTYDETLCKILEPNVCTTKHRVEVLKQMKKRNIPTIVWLDPILPRINDTKENIEGILEYCIEAGVYGIIMFNMGLTLRDGNREYFYQKLDPYFPGLKQFYIDTYGLRYEIISEHNNELTNLFHSICESHHILHNNDTIFTYMHTYEQKEEATQLSLFDFL